MLIYYISSIATSSFRFQYCGKKTIINKIYYTEKQVSHQKSTAIVDLQPNSSAINIDRSTEGH